MFDDEEDKLERSEFYANSAKLMDVIPGNFDHADGEKAVIITLAKGTDIEQIALPMEDGREMATKLLVALATYEDAFAMRLLDDHFAADDHGNFKWPKAELDD